MKKWTLTLVSALAAVSLGAAQVVRAGHGGDLHGRIAKLLHGGAEQGLESHLDAVVARLELTETQRKQVASVLTTALAGLEARALTLVEAHAKQIELVHAPAIDDEAIREASARVGAAQGELAVAVAHLLRDLHGVLTPEQRERAAHVGRPELLAGITEHVRAISKDVRAWADRQ
jgi:Spy/CpxP family protein refolding chaperone